MNILFFLTPKSEVIYVNEEDTVGQAMDTMEKYKYSAVPIITKAGRYAGTFNADMEDLLGKIMNQNFVPVLDDQKNFIGIITRKDVISYLCKK